MITFKHFLAETTNAIKKWSQVEISHIEAIELLNAHCKDGLSAITKGELLFRGMDAASAKSIFTIDASTGTRLSRDSNNIYQLMFDSSEDLDGFPKRSKSLICSSSIEAARPYGSTIFVVFPYDGTTMAISERGDFFSQKIYSRIFSAEGAKLRITELSKMFNALFESLKIEHDYETPEGKSAYHFRKYSSAEMLDQKLSEFTAVDIVAHYNSVCEIYFGEGIVQHHEVEDPKQSAIFFSLKTGEKLPKETVEYFEKSKFKGKAASIFYALMKNNPSKRFTSLATYLFNPATTEVTLEKYAHTDFDGDIHSGGHEVWFSGPAVLISVKVFEEILKQLKEGNFPIHPALINYFMV
jgi:hypothetical protein